MNSDYTTCDYSNLIFYDPYEMKNVGIVKDGLADNKYNDHVFIIYEDNNNGVVVSKETLAMLVTPSDVDSLRSIKYVCKPGLNHNNLKGHRDVELREKFIDSRAYGGLEGAAIRIEGTLSDIVTGRTQHRVFKTARCDELHALFGDRTEQNNNRLTSQYVLFKLAENSAEEWAIGENKCAIGANLRKLIPLVARQERLLEENVTLTKRNEILQYIIIISSIIAFFQIITYYVWKRSAENKISQSSRKKK
tara:strand:- start:2776 stop:3522 length:747 start_codon:yes stop_codon:yes gene_type:complete